MIELGLSCLTCQIAMEGRAGIHIKEIFQDGIDEKCAGRIAKNVLKAQGTASPYEISLLFSGFKAMQQLSWDCCGVAEGADVYCRQIMSNETRGDKAL